MKTRSAIFALLLLGGFYVYRYRFQIQRFAESRGIRIPLFGTNLGEKIQSGIAKVTGKTEYLGKQLDEGTRKAV